MTVTVTELQNIFITVVICGLLLSVIVYSLTSYFELTEHENIQLTISSKSDSVAFQSLFNVKSIKSTNRTNMFTQEEQIQYPNLPIDFLQSYGKRNNTSVRKRTCAQFPKIYDLKFSYDYWQVLLSTKNETFYFLNAYYDNRKNNPWGASIRILGMINAYPPMTKTYCQLWFKDLDTPVMTEEIHYDWMWRENWEPWFLVSAPYQPFLLTCRIPNKFRNKIPSAVSVVENPCGSLANALQLIYNKPAKKKQFAVCVKGLDFLDLDISVRLIEWIELLKILGADDIYFYQYNVHPNVSKVLQHYQKLGFVHVTLAALAGKQPNIPLLQHLYLILELSQKRRHEILTYNDCLYRNMHSYKYIVLIDIDEVLMPVAFLSWDALMRNAEKKFGDNTYSICSRVAYFLNNMTDKYGTIRSVPKYLHMLQHVYRSQYFPIPNYRTKCFHNPEYVVILNNHIPFARFSNSSYALLSASEAILQHFRYDCVGHQEECAWKYIINVTLDTSVWKFKKQLIKRSLGTLKELHFL